MSTINERIIHQLKNNKSLNQKGLAEYLGRGTSTISQWLTQGRDIPSDCIIPICEYLQVSIFWLLTGSDVNITDMTTEEKEWLNLYKDIPISERKECIGFIKGYIAHGDMHGDTNKERQRKASGN